MCTPEVGLEFASVISASISNSSSCFAARNFSQSLVLSVPIIVLRQYILQKALPKNQRGKIMIIWSGYGFLGVLIPFVILLGGAPLLRDRVPESVDDVIILLISALLVWFVGRRLNNQPERVVKDMESGEIMKIKQNHTLFWIPMQYFAFLWAAIGIYVIYGIATK